MKKVISLGICLSVSWACTPIVQAVYAAEPKVDLAALVAERKLQPAKGYDTKYCQDFLDSFRRQVGIKHLQPEVVVSDYDNTALQGHLRNCGSPAFDLRRKYTGSHIGTPTFKLFITHEQEFVFLEEGFWERSVRANNYVPYIGGDAIYTFVDAKACTRSAKLNMYTSRTFDIGADVSTKKPVASWHGVIQYRDAYGVYRLKENPFDVWVLTFIVFDKNYRKGSYHGWRYQCAYDSNLKRDPTMEADD